MGEDKKTGPYLIDVDAGGVRASQFDGDGFPETLTFYRRYPLSAAGALFDGRITKLDRANDQAFLDIGGSTAVLPVRRAKHLAPKSVSGRPVAINDCVQEGQLIRVQGVADALVQDGKALTVTARPRLVGRYAIVEAGSDGTALRVNPSKTIAAAKSARLTAALKDTQSQSGTIILRSAAGAVDDDIVLAEVGKLIDTLYQDSSTPGLLHETDAIEAALRDTPEGATSIITTATDQSVLKGLIRRQYPDLLTLEIYPDVRLHDDAPLTDILDEAIDEALADRIALPSGGSLSIHTTPALTAVDVNLGNAFDGRTAAEAKRLTNMEAALALAYHLRFQNIGGLVVVDFINMTGKGAIKDLMSVLNEALAEDSVPVQHGGISQFGLMELTRNRSGLSLADQLQTARAPVPRTEETLITLLNRATRLGLSAEPGDLVITLTPAMQSVLDTAPILLSAVEDQTRRTVKLETGKPDCRLDA